MNAVAGLDGRRTMTAEDPSVLERIMGRDVELAMWRRPRPPALAWIDEFAWNGIDDLDFPVAVPVLDGEIADGLAEAGYPRDERSAALRNEIVALTRRFAAIIGCDMVRLRLEVVDTDACRRFHSDLVLARLLTTLFGPGTQWIEAGSPKQVNQLKAGDVAIFKGRLLAEEPAILHRSPPIAGTGDTRLLLAIDPSDPDQADEHG